MTTHLKLPLTLLALVGTTSLATSASAKTFLVNTDTDSTVDNTSCSLREAIEAANGFPLNDDCGFKDAGLTTIKVQAGHTYVISGSHLIVTTSMTIQTTTTNSRATITGPDFAPTLAVVTNTPTDVTINDLILRHNSATSSFGPGLEIDTAHAKLNRVVLKNNAVGIYILDPGELTTDTVAIHDNDQGFGPGGGIRTDGPGSIMHIFRTSIYNNKAGLGGEIYSAGNIELRDSTLADNEARDAGGGLYLESTTIQGDMRGCTVYRNKAPAGTGAGWHRVGTPTFLITKTIVSGNLGPGPNCVGIGSDIDATYSLYDASCTPGNGGHNIINSNPQLATGRTTKDPENIGYKPASSTSRVHDKGGPLDGEDEPKDQHSKGRNTAGGGVDIGALELNGL